MNLKFCSTSINKDVLHWRASAADTGLSTLYPPLDQPSIYHSAPRQTPVNDFRKWGLDKLQFPARLTALLLLVSTGGVKINTKRKAARFLLEMKV